MKAKIGRRTKLTSENIKKMAQSISNGVPYVRAAALLGISNSTFHYWKSEAEELKEKVESGMVTRVRGSKNLLLLDFLDSIEEATAKFINRNIALIQVAAEKDWKAAAWGLERRCPAEFGSTKKIDMTSRNRKAYEGMTNEELEAELEELNKLKADIESDEEDEDDVE